MTGNNEVTPICKQNKYGDALSFYYLRLTDNILAVFDKTKQIQWLLIIINIGIKLTIYFNKCH